MWARFRSAALQCGLNPNQKPKHPIHRESLLALGLLLLCSALPLLAASNSLPPLPALQRELTAHISQKKFESAQWGIKVLSLRSGAVLFETNAHKLLKPASTAKVFTGAMALDVLQPNTKIRTSLFAKNLPDANGRLAGDLIIYGRGDPTFSARFRDGSYTNLLGALVQSLRRSGVKEIAGDLVADETFFSGPRYGESWTWDDLQYYYGAEVSALTVQDNVVDLFLTPGAKAGDPCRLLTKPETQYLEFVNRTRTTATNVAAGISIMRPLNERKVYITGTLPVKHGTYVEAVTVPNPAQWFAEMFRDTLQKEGISLRGKIRTRSWPDDSPVDLRGYRETAFTESAPVAEIVAKMLKPSQNLYAQLLLLQAGARSAQKSRFTEDAGVHELRAFAQRAGIDPGEVLLDEGSGLSRSCLVTPHALVTLLQHMSRHPHGAIFRDSLPAPGEGTLRLRFRDWREGPGAKLDLRAKTGSIRYVSALAGYITPNGEPLAFAVILNAYPGADGPRDQVEAVVRLIARLSEK